MVPFRRESLSPVSGVCPPTVGRSKVVHTDIFNEFVANGKRFCIWSCCPGFTCGPVFMYRFDRINRAGGPQYPRGRNLSLVTSSR